MAEQKKSTHVAVVGGGPGGYGAAFLAADLGLEVTLVDPEANPGGVCLYRGCIPTKALLHLARTIGLAREAAGWGVRFQEPEIDVDRVREWMGEVVARLTGGMGQLAGQRKIEYVRGRARFLDGRSLEVDGEEGKRKISFDRAVIATGSRSAPLPDLSIQAPGVMDSESALQLAKIPKRLLVVGGGYIGLEMGTIYSALGSRVTVVEMTSGLMPGADRDLVKVFAGRTQELFHEVRLDTRAEIREQKNGFKVIFNRGGQRSEEQPFDGILLAVGRKPNSEGLGLEKLRVKLDDRGFIQVDRQRQTAEPGIFAVGDVAGGPLLAHKATHEGRVAAEVMAGGKSAYEPRAIPAVLYTDPEVAWCGLTESQAREEGRAVSVARFPWAASGRNVAMGRREGLTKLVVDPGSERILGVGIAGAHAGDLIAEGVLAVEMAAVATDLALTMHPHPTLSETVMEAAEAYQGLATSIYRPRRS